MLKAIALASLVGAVGYFAWFTVYIYLQRRKFRHIPGSKTRGIRGFYWGDLDKVIKMKAEKKIYPDLILECCQKYGHTFRLQFLNRFVVITADPEAIKKLLIIDNVPKFDFGYKFLGFPFDERFLGNGLVTDINNERWRNKRALFNPAFHRQFLMNSMSEFNSKTNILLERLRNLADGKTTVVLFKELNHVALDVIASIAFGIHVDSINDPNNELNNYISDSLAGVEEALERPFMKIDPRNWKNIEKYKESMHKLRKFGREIIENRLQQMKEHVYIKEDMLSIILKAYTDENQEFDTEDMIDEFITFFVAGQETTANTLAFCFMELFRRPDILKKLREELERVIGSNSEITFDNLAELQYTACIIKETLRLYPPVAIISREATANLKISGYKVPQGTWLNISTYACGRLPEFFPEPLEFRPERFSKEQSSSTGRNNYSYFPFSMGPRNCIGQNFAMMEAKIIVSKLALNFDFEIDPNQDFSVVQMTTLRPSDGVRCTLRPR